tara:strand:- start:96 stop:674 length:579 start_codon:yes stop_codon:yes gene_type:complete
MIRLAVVGDIGSGKSYVAKKFGYPVFNADEEVKKLYKKNRKCFTKLKKSLPQYITSFPLKKSEITNAVEDNDNNLKKITKIIHPEIRKKLRNFEKKNKKRKIIVLDIPLLIENKINTKRDVLIYVDAKKNEIIKRLKKRSNFNLKMIKKLKKFQLPLEIKKKKSNFLIKNNFKSNYLRKDVNIIKKKILNNV